MSWGLCYVHVGHVGLNAVTNATFALFFCTPSGIAALRETTIQHISCANFKAARGSSDSERLARALRQILATGSLGGSGALAQDGRWIDFRERTLVHAERGRIQSAERRSGDGPAGWSERGFYPHASKRFTALLCCDVEDARGANQGQKDPEPQEPEGADRRHVIQHCWSDNGG